MSTPTPSPGGLPPQRQLSLEESTRQLGELNRQLRELNARLEVLRLMMRMGVR